MPAFLYVRMEEFMRSTDNKKDNKVLMSLRIYAEDKEQIEEKARKTGLTTSEYIRRCAGRYFSPMQILHLPSRA